MNEVVPRGLVPPRPNLGPEPWQYFEPMSRWVPAVGVLIFLLLAVLFWWWYRRKVARARMGILAPGVVDGPDRSPRERLVALSGSIRDALTVPFGNSCRAKTTEELAADRRLEQLLGDEQLRELIRFLDQIDRLKFAAEGSQHHPGDALEEALTSWEPRVETLRAHICAKPQNRAKPPSPEANSRNGRHQSDFDRRKTQGDLTTKDANGTKRKS